MTYKNDLVSVKSNIKNHLGQKVKLQCGRGAHQTVIDDCIVTKTYPDVFMVQTYQNQRPYRKLCFSYVDVMTNAITIIFNN